MTADNLRPGYPRTTSVDFLKQCSPRVASFYRFWDSKRNGREMPSRADFDPVEMKEWLSGIIIVDVLRNPRRLVYRLVGTKSVELKGRDVTGLSVEEGFFGATLADILENYRLVTEDRKIVYDWDKTLAGNGFLRESETLFLPLSSDGGIVDKVLVYLETETI